MQKKLLIVSIFGDPSSDDNSRLNSIYDFAEADKLIVTADFNHNRKELSHTDSVRKTHYIHVPGYKKNLSVARIYSHLVFAVRLKRFLNDLDDKPYVIYCAMPTSSAAYVCGRYCKKNQVRFVVDVVDLWPDSLLPISFIFKFLKVFLLPWKWMTIKAYRFADIIMGESQKYVEEASKFNLKAPGFPLYLGVDRNLINKLVQSSKLNVCKPDSQLWICYAGNLGNSYDFSYLLDAVKHIHPKYDYKLLFIGDGDYRNEILLKIDSYGLNASVTGYLSYADYLKYLSCCDIGVNIFRENTHVVHSYKFNDYVASNLFVLNSLGGETAEMTDYYKIGVNFDFKSRLLTNVLEDVCMNWEKYKEYKINTNKFIDEILDKRVIYPKVLSEILK